MKRNEFVKNAVLLIAGLFFSIHANTCKILQSNNSPFYPKGNSTKRIGGLHAGGNIFSSSIPK